MASNPPGMAALAKAVLNPVAANVEDLRRLFQRADGRFMEWAAYVDHVLNATGWNVQESTREQAKGIQKSNTIHSDPVFAEVSRMQGDETLAEVYDTHNAWKAMPMVWRKAIWLIYVVGYSSHEMIGKHLGMEKKHVGVVVKQVFEEFEQSLRTLQFMRGVRA